MIELQGERFEFGKNWQQFLGTISRERIEIAEHSLEEHFPDGLRGKTFLDIGSGSGLFSLCARRLGATVHSFDYDPQSVACTKELRRRYFPDDPEWTIEQGSIVDHEFVQNLGRFDRVYSWGVLHHTGDMWKALEYAGEMVKSDGTLFISIYNDQGGWSRRWQRIKRFYNQLPSTLRVPYTVAIMGPREIRLMLVFLLKCDPIGYVRSWTDYQRLSLRGMSRWHDMVDWVGGYPFEVAKPEQIFNFYRDRGFVLRNLKTTSGTACNEFVFSRDRKLQDLL